MAKVLTNDIKVPYCLPLIDNDVIAEVNDTLVNTGWLTTGPKVKLFEEKLEQYCGVEKVLAVNSWNSGTQLMLRWFGIKAGDEVIIPAYTYSATALAAINLGAKVIMVDVGEDFNINVQNISKAITTRTKVIIPVDIGGWPCDYFELHDVLIQHQHLFMPESQNQEALGRILVLADAAHSIGAEYDGKRSGAFCDVAVFSFHSVKNITTGEGGAVCLNLPKPFDNKEVYSFLKHFHLYGQTKSAKDKVGIGKWRYDIVSPGMKANMNDVSASIGLSQLRRYEATLLPERLAMFEKYNQAFSTYDWALTCPLDNDGKRSSGHLYMLRFLDLDEAGRDEMIHELSQCNIGVSVHYIPMAMMTYFKSVGYNIDDYPVTYKNYAHEISLPLYNTMTTEQQAYTISKVIDLHDKVTKKSI